MNDGFTLLRFSTDAVPAKDRVEVMREIYGRAILKVDVEPDRNCPLHVDMGLRVMPGLGFAAGRTTRLSVRHTASLIDSDDLVLLMSLGGRSVMKHRGREELLEEGGALLMTCAEVGMNTLQSDLRFINLRLPRIALSPLVADLPSALMRPVPRNSEALRLLGHYTDVLRNMGPLATPEIQRLAAVHVHDLVALAVGATKDAAEAACGRGVRAARLHKIKADIVARLAEPLSSGDVAARHRVSERYFRKLFAEDGTSFSHFVIAQRLARVHRMLHDRRLDLRPIGQLAFDVGFNDLSYFNRAFRQRFGMTPSDVRSASKAREPDGGKLR